MDTKQDSQSQQQQQQQQQQPQQQQQQQPQPPPPQPQQQQQQQPQQQQPQQQQQLPHAQQPPPTYYQPPQHHPPHPNPYMQYPQTHHAYYPHHPQQMQQPQYSVPQQGAPMYSPHPPHPGTQQPPHHPQSHPQSHPQGHPQQPPPHWVYGPQQPAPSQHMVQHPHPQQPQGYYQPAQQPPHPYMAYPPQAPHAYYPHHPQQMQPPPPHYSVPQQGAPMYSPHPPHPAAQQPQQHPPSQMPGHQPSYPQQGPPPHWVYRQAQPAPPPPHPQQHMMPHPPPHPQQHIMQHPPQQMTHPQHPPAYYQPAQPPPQPVPGPPPPQQQLPPPASPHHPPSQTHTPPVSHTPTRVPPPSSTPKIEKKDITFPRNSVEATKPIATKKRKITSKDVTDIEVWRLLMCLKSGLLAESSWAIDVLSILLNDDATLMHFGLQHMPGLLEAVLEHFKCCLNELFDGMVEDTTLKPTIIEIKPAEKVPIENGNKNCTNKNNNKTKGKSNVTEENHNNNNNNNSTNNVNNNHKPVQDEALYELVFKPVGYSHWQEGNGEDTSHIQVYFKPDSFIESSRRCTCLSTILRNLSFIPGNDVEMSKHAGLLLVLGRLLLLKHDDVVHDEPASGPSEWHLLSSLREDTLVIVSNISSSLDLSPYNDKINLSLLDGLLHWACCSSSYALDPFPAPSMTVSPQRLALESLAKLSIIEGNVDLILATPPWSRIEKLFEVLARLLNINEDQTIREFSLVLLSNLTAADSGIARKVALTGSAIPRLISFLETSLADPESFATTQDMLRRAALTLKCLSQLVDNHPLFGQHQQRLLNLVMSQKLDQEVVPIIADVIFEISLSN